MNKIKCTLPRRGFNARSRGTSMKYEEKEYLNVTCNRLVYSLSSVSPVRKQRDREEFLLTLIKAEPYTFLYYVGPEPKNPRKCKETRILRRNSRPRSSFEIGPKESRIEATDRKTKLSLTLAVLFVFLFFCFFWEDFYRFHQPLCTIVFLIIILRLSPLHRLLPLISYLFFLIAVTCCVPSIVIYSLSCFCRRN